MERRYSELLVRQEEEKSRGPVAALNRMVTIPVELNMDHLKFHLISETGKKMEKEWNNRIRSNQEEMKGMLWFLCTSKKRHWDKTIRKHMNYGER